MVDSINNNTNTDPTYYTFTEVDNQAAQKTEKKGPRKKPDHFSNETSKETFEAYETWINEILTSLGLDSIERLDLKKLTQIIRDLEKMLDDPNNPNARMTRDMFDLADNLLKSLAAKGFTGSGYQATDGTMSAEDAFKAWQEEVSPKANDINANLATTKRLSLNSLEALYALVAFGALNASLAIFENLSKDFGNIEELLAKVTDAINNMLNKAKVNRQNDLHNPPESMDDFPFDDQKAFDAIYKAFKDADVEVETIKGTDGIEYIVLANGDKFPVYKYENGKIVIDQKTGKPEIMDDPDFEQIFESIYRQEQAEILAELERRKGEVPPPTLSDVAKNYTKTAEFIKQYVFNDEEDPSKSVSAMREALEVMYTKYVEQVTALQLEVNAVSGEEFKKLYEALFGTKDPENPDLLSVLEQLKAMDPPPDDIINPLEKVLTMLKGAHTGIGKNPEDVANLTAEDYMRAASYLINKDPDGKFSEYLQQAGGAMENKTNSLSNEVKEQNQKVQAMTQYATTGIETLFKMLKTMIQGWR